MPDMDLETENRLAALVMEEARRLRLQAEKEGVHVYLHQPNVRGRPNSRFLTATVLGVQQANRTVEVTEMWRAREKELELEAKLEDRSKKQRHKSRGEKHRTNSPHMGSSSRHKKENTKTAISCSTSKQDLEDCCSYEDDGLRDEEVEEFLHSRAKRGRGAVGSRMDEAGPYLSQTCSDQDGRSPSHDVRVKEEWENRILGPEKPSFLKLDSALCDDSDTETRVCHTSGSRKCHSKKRRSREEKLGKRKRTEKRSKHHSKSRRAKD
ncbi:hypothetical protein MUK42_24676 [Musa troglodytarum]|uniref:Uncharacterized protein n=1 Tax=Musa troglodytarum TaxID=320322 RepID=A0A9E7GG72_9LILI|nr:hypothetical protein MUK42_24676 [Musa troglodytarum]